MSLSVATLGKSMLAAMKPVLEEYWKDVSEYAKTESKKTAQTIAAIEKLKLAGKIDRNQARALLDMQKHATQAVLLAVEGIGIAAAQNAINAALGAVRKVVNDAVGFKLV